MDAGVRSERLPGKMATQMGEVVQELQMGHSASPSWSTGHSTFDPRLTFSSAQLSIQTASEDGRNCPLNSNHALGCLESFLEHISHGRRRCHDR